MLMLGYLFYLRLLFPMTCLIFVPYLLYLYLFQLTLSTSFVACFVCVFFDSSTLYASSAPSMSFDLCDLFAGYTLSVLFASCVFYGLSTVCASFAPLTSSVACSIYVFCDLFYLFLYYKSQPRVFTLS